MAACIDQTASRMAQLRVGVIRTLDDTESSVVGQSQTVVGSASSAAAASSSPVEEEEFEESDCKYTDEGQTTGQSC